MSGSMSMTFLWDSLRPGPCPVHSFYHMGLPWQLRDNSFCSQLAIHTHTPLLLVISVVHENGASGRCLVCSQVLCLWPSTHMSSCQSMDKMSSMPTVAKIWVTWTPTSLLWQKKPTSRWPGKRHLSSAVPQERRTKGHVYFA